jgi:hypothetical protein
MPSASAAIADEGGRMSAAIQNRLTLYNVSAPLAEHAALVLAAWMVLL